MNKYLFVCSLTLVCLLTACSAGSLANTVIDDSASSPGSALQESSASAENYSESDAENSTIETIDVHVSDISASVSSEDTLSVPEAEETPSEEMSSSAVKPTGYASGEVQIPFLYYHGQLWLPAGELTSEVPDGYVLAGNVQQVDNRSVPQEEFAASHLMLHAAVYANEEKPDLIIIDETVDPGADLRFAYYAPYIIEILSDDTASDSAENSAFNDTEADSAPSP